MVLYFEENGRASKYGPIVVMDIATTSETEPKLIQYDGPSVILSDSTKIVNTDENEDVSWPVIPLEGQVLLKSKEPYIGVYCARENTIFIRKVDFQNDAELKDKIREFLSDEVLASCFNEVGE